MASEQELANLQAYLDDPTAVDAGYKALVESSMWNVVRIERNKLLAESDWTVVPDSPLSASKVEEWKTYRQALRDMPAEETVTMLDIDQNIDVEYPTKPS